MLSQPDPSVKASQNHIIFIKNCKKREQSPHISYQLTIIEKGKPSIEKPNINPRKLKRHNSLTMFRKSMLHNVPVTFLNKGTYFC